MFTQVLYAQDGIIQIVNLGLISQVDRILVFQLEWWLNGLLRGLFIQLQLAFESKQLLLNFCQVKRKLSLHSQLKRRGFLSLVSPLSSNFCPIQSHLYHILIFPYSLLKLQFLLYCKNLHENLGTGHYLALYLTFVRCRECFYTLCNGLFRKFR